MKFAQRRTVRSILKFSFRKFLIQIDQIEERVDSLDEQVLQQEITDIGMMKTLEHPMRRKKPIDHLDHVSEIAPEAIVMIGL